MSMKIAIVGYGSMGKEIETVAQLNNIKITNIFDIDNPIADNSYDFDVAIDFSTPQSVINNVKLLAKLKKNIVIGTTSWYENSEEVKNICLENEIGCIWSSNFSIGMQIFFRILTETTKLCDNFNLYDMFISDIHHSNKIDSPSGTAVKLANIIIQNSKQKQKILTEQINRKINSDELHVSAIRGGSITGTHTVYFDSNADTIELTHRAKNRRGFAEGAIIAANWIYNKKGFYCFENVLF
ncbi:4-hydroxy-tetrahydrodipicolinate reductase [bioreactor metagenome]|uniref:4-hydroxy-tetrahydrodipicolinate reductase n=1 Tax=bioreactor metagenome TaxID=1076179 RepID=A0A645DJL2_9ZZZZ